MNRGGIGGGAAETRGLAVRRGSERSGNKDDVERRVFAGSQQEPGRQFVLVADRTANHKLPGVFLQG